MVNVARNFVLGFVLGLWHAVRAATSIRGAHAPFNKDDGVSPYQSELDRTFAKMLSAAVSRDGLTEVVELEEVPEITADQPLLDGNLKASFESLGTADRCILNSQTGRRTVVDQVLLRGSLAWNFSFNDSLTEYTVLFGTHIINSTNLQTLAGLCSNRSATSPREVYAIPRIQVSPEDEMHESVGEQQSAGDLIQQCERKISVALSISCGLGDEFEIGLFPNSGIAGTIEPREILDLSYDPSIYILQIFTVLALALETLFVGGTLFELRHKKFAIRHVALKSKWFLALLVSAAIMFVTGILSVSV